MPLYIVNVDIGFPVNGKIHRCNSVIELPAEHAEEGVKSGRLLHEKNDKYLTKKHIAALAAFRAVANSITGPVTAGTVIGASEGVTVVAAVDQTVERDAEGRVLGQPVESVEKLAVAGPAGESSPSRKNRNQ